MPAAPWSVRFSDGSGNTTTIAQTAADADVTYDYAPVTPENSSSGIYSGGEPASGVLDAAMAAELWQRVDALEASSDKHVEQRMMGTGQFQISRGDATSRFIFANGDELQQFVAFVGGIRD